MTPAFIGLGSNVADRLATLKRACELLDATDGVRFVRCSAVYETVPVGPPQADYLNAVVEIATSLAAAELLEACKAIEASLGRVERATWGPREIDLDLLLYGTEEVRGPGLSVPHPEMARRAFVLVPLADIAPYARIPGQEGRVAQLAAAIDQAGVRFAFRPEELWPDS